jgi:hypothetical protein
MAALVQRAAVDIVMQDTAGGTGSRRNRDDRAAKDLSPIQAAFSGAVGRSFAALKTTEKIERVLPDASS